MPEMNEDALVVFGGELKALGAGKYGGYLVLFGDETKTDTSPMRDYFTKETDFGPHQTTTVYYHHGFDGVLKRRVLDENASLKKDDVGVWVEGQLKLRDKYERAVYKLIEDGKLGLSSGTATHLVEREQKSNGAHHIRKWPLGLDASFTPTPAEPRTMVAALKSLQPAPSLEDLAPELKAGGDEDGVQGKGPEGQAGSVEVEVDGETLQSTKAAAGKTNFPAEGDNLPVTLANSRHALFPPAEAAALKRDYPEVWGKGGNIKGNQQYEALSGCVGKNSLTPAQEDAVRLREAWVARHAGNFELPGVVAQVKWLAVGSRGLDHMRGVLKEAKAKVDEGRKPAVKAMSLMDQCELVREATRILVTGKRADEDDRRPYVPVTVYPDFVVYGRDGAHWKRSYTLLDGAVTFGDTETQVEREWLPVKALTEWEAPEVKELSLAQIEERVREAVRMLLFGTTDYNEKAPWVDTYIFPAYVVYRPKDKDFVRRSWALVDGKVTLGDDETRVEQTWEPVKSLEMDALLSLGESTFEDHSRKVLAAVEGWDARLRAIGALREAKAGRVLSQVNRERLAGMVDALTPAMEQMHSVIDGMRKLLDETATGPAGSDSDATKALDELRLAYLKDWSALQMGADPGD